MSQIPEDILQEIMQMSGVSHKEAEKILNKALAETLNGPIFQAQTPNKRNLHGENPKFSQVNYPHFLPSDEIKKYTIRVSLKGVTPVIWRKFECPSNISLRHLTELLIPLMGWQNAHLNHILQGQDTFYVPYYQHDPELDWGDHRYQEEYMLSDLLREKGKTVRWEYDFGDSWMHEIRLSSVEEYKKDEPHSIVYKSGKRLCPPEDCGGIWGYQELLDLHEKRKSRKRLTTEEKERLEWYGIDKDYDPEEDFDELDCAFVCECFTAAKEGSSPFMDEPMDFLEDAFNDKFKDVAPMVTSPLYDEVLHLAFRLRELEPWEDLDDSDVYAVKMQDGTEIYIATMGNAGGLKDVQFYDGAESFQQYLFALRGQEMPYFESMDTHYWADYTSILFLNAMDEAADPEQYARVRQWADTHGEGIHPDCGYPVLQRYRPHRYPSMMLNEEQDLARLKKALEAVLWLSQQLLDVDDFDSLGFVDGKYPTEKGGKIVPLVVKTRDGYKVERTKLPGLSNNYPTVALSEHELQPLHLLPKSGTQYCRLIHLPGFIGSKDDRDHSYSALVLACINKNGENASMTEPCEWSDDHNSDVLRQYINKVKKEGTIPQRIITDHPRTHAFLKDFCSSFGIILELKRHRLPELSHLCQFMYEFEG